MNFNRKFWPEMTTDGGNTMQTIQAIPADRGCRVTFRVRYYETDMMGITHHSNYLRWFEVARTEYLREAGMPYRSLEDMGLDCPVIGVRCRYLHPSRYDDLITVQTWVKATMAFA